MPSIDSKPRHRSLDPRAPLHLVLEERSKRQPDDLALRHLVDGESQERNASFSDIHDLSRRCSTGLQRLALSGKPVLLALPPGIEFVAALFGCWHASAIPVPVYPPRGARHRERFLAVAEDCGATHAILSTGQMDETGVIQLDFDELTSHPPSQSALAGGGSTCLLQYTSGSTAHPKGVRISHANLRAHFKSLSCFQNLNIQSALSWLPPYHDMGLVLKILYAMEAGIPLTVLSPDHFIQRPLRWLQAISRYRVEMTGAPNFAFEACIRSVSESDIQSLDLSSWKAAPCGAERIRPETLKRFAAKFAPCGFREEAFLPGYGLAETTLIVTARQSGGPPLVTHHPTAGPVVSCGLALDGNQVRIANPETGIPVDDGSIGEIIVSGPVVSEGYWNSDEDSNETTINGALRTGDLGFISNGELHVTGRIKDLIIIDGRNISPEDIECAVMANHPEILATAAFPVEEDDREVIGLAIEAPRPRDPDALFVSIRNSLLDRLGVNPAMIHLVRHGLLPRTTSGKIRRHACSAFLSARKSPVWRESATVPTSVDHEGVLGDLLGFARDVLEMPDLGPEDDIVSLGIGSLDATRLAARIRARTGIHLPVRTIFSSRSFRDLAVHLQKGANAGHPSSRLDVRAEASVSKLTHAQERMWFLHQLDPSSAAYHVFGAAELMGPLDLQRLRSSYQDVVLRHEILSSRHGNRDGNPDVRLVASQPALIDEAAAATDEDAVSLLQDFARRPFDLANDAPIRALLVTMSENRHLLGICAHHIAADGWSIRILSSELANIYAGMAFSTPAPSYLDYSRSHRKWLDDGAADAQIDYWRSKLAGHPGVSILPTDFPNPAKPSSYGGFHCRMLSNTLVDAVAKLARKYRTTPFTVHITLFILLLRQHGGGNDHVIAVPVANRNHDTTTGLVGTLVNTLPFRLQVSPSESFVELLERAGSEVFEMIENQDAPFERIIDAVNPERSNQHPPLAQVMFDHQELPIEQSWPGGIQCRPFQVHRGAAQFDLSLFLTSYGTRQQIGIEFREDLFRESTVAAMLDRYQALISRVCDSPGMTVRDLSAIPPSDVAMLNSCSRGPMRGDFLGKSALELITSRAALHPDRPAIHASGELLTYGQLDGISSNIAFRLRKQGIAKGSRVAILLERDHLLPCTILALWKLGAAYVPLDQANPPQRLRLILEDQAPIPVLVSPALSQRVPDAFPIIVLDAFAEAPPVDESFPGSAADDLAYVIYTSGSTGVPKGTCISHEALANFLLSMAETPGFTEADHLLAVTTISFDISCLEIFLPLIAGGSVEIATSDQARDGIALRRVLTDCRPTIMQATPATWRLLIEAGWKGAPDMKILCGGEPLDLPLAERLSGLGRQLWNLYGPTETTVWSSCWQVPEQAGHIRIGAPIANTGLHVLSDDGEPLPPGAVGHLWISGGGLADGYWRNAALTDDRFRTIRDHEGRPIRAYQTGDLARWHSDGQLECLGRTDGQVKIRGFRVELGEIEAVLNAHPDVDLAKVDLRSGKHDDRRIVAWIKPAVQGQWNKEALLAHLTGRLPGYMIPSEITTVEAFPQTSSGKVDIKQLPTPEPEYHEVVEEMTHTEREMSAIWSELLGRTSVALDDNWFHLGGHSLLALRLFSVIHQRFNCHLPLSAILEHPNPRSLAAQVDRAKRTDNR